VIGKGGNLPRICADRERCALRFAARGPSAEREGDFSFAYPALTPQLVLLASATYRAIIGRPCRDLGLFGLDMIFCFAVRSSSLTPPFAKPAKDGASAVWWVAILDRLLSCWQRLKPFKISLVRHD
jgi:hypothetical protein